MENPGRDLLSDEQIRVLGCLIEKERTTPADYPLTANSVMRASNQATSRDPVVSYDERLVTQALESLKPLGLARFVHSQSNRSVKFRQTAQEQWSLADDEIAVLGLLMLRGPQTAGELKIRSERLHSFDDLHHVVECLERLARHHEPFVVEIPRRTGQKDTRWVHLLSGPVDVETIEISSHPRATSSGDTQARIEALEAEVARLGQLVSKVASELGISLVPEMDLE